MTREPVTDDELARAGALIESSEMAALSRMDEVADRLSMYATYFDRPELINEQLGRYLAVDADAIRAVCAEVFGTPQRAVLTYVPRSDERGRRGMSDLARARPAPGPGRAARLRLPRLRAVQPSRTAWSVILAHVPGRPLLQAQLIVRGDAGGGAISEAADQAGVTVLTARAMSEGTERRDAVALVEAAERLGAELGATAGWDSLGVHVEVPRTRLAPGPRAAGRDGPRAELPGARGRAPPRGAPQRPEAGDGRPAPPRRARSSPRRSTPPAPTYARSLGGTEETVAALDREALAARHAQPGAARGQHAHRLRRPRGRARR